MPRPLRSEPPRSGPRRPRPLAVVPAPRRVVVVHDYLTQRGGAERVVLALVQGLRPSAVVTSVHEPAGCFPEFGAVPVRTSWLQRVPLLRSHHRWAFPLYAPTFSSMAIDAEVTVCSTSGWAHGVRATGKKVLYVHNTARWLYQGEDYLRGRPAPLRAVAQVALAPLRRWDRRRAADADLVLANSAATAGRIRTHWGREATVVHPPHAAAPGGEEEPQPGIEPGYLLVVSRLLAYKHVDAVVGAMALLPDKRLVVVGDGPEAGRLRAVAGDRVTLLGVRSEAALRWLYRNASAVVAAAMEDFGLVPLEAMAHGRPVVARRAGGYLETVVEGRTGVFFDQPEPSAIAEAVRRADRLAWDRSTIEARAAEFGVDAFTARVAALVDELVAPPARQP